MKSLVGRQLKEMAELGRLRKQKVVLISSILAATVLSLNGILLYLDEKFLYCLFNVSCALVAFGNVIYLRRKRSRHADLILTSLLLAQAMVLLVLGDIEGNKLFWICPIVAAIIFINRFQTGLFLSVGFCLLSALSVLTHHAEQSPNTILASDYFILSLISLTAICNTSAYFYSKAMRYIHSLYREGIEELAYTDQLTGLANRWSFENWATSKLAERKEPHSITALVFLDIDNFKAINDNYGHDVGDRVLKHFAQRLRNNVRHRDRRTERHDYSIARFAGDEFVLLLYDVNTLTDLDNILHRISHLFEDRYQERETKLLNHLTVSAGAALFPQDADNLEELTRCADKAMYAAKHGGKNQYRYYQSVSAQHDGQAVEVPRTNTPLTDASLTDAPRTDAPRHVTPLAHVKSSRHS